MFSKSSCNTRPTVMLWWPMQAWLFVWYRSNGQSVITLTVHWKGYNPGKKSGWYDSFKIAVDSPAFEEPAISEEPTQGSSYIAPNEINFGGRKSSRPSHSRKIWTHVQILINCSILKRMFHFYRASAINLECHLISPKKERISFSILNLIGLFLSECGKRDIEN